MNWKSHTSVTAVVVLALMLATILTFLAPRNVGALSLGFDLELRLERVLHQTIDQLFGTNRNNPRRPSASPSVQQPSPEQSQPASPSSTTDDSSGSTTEGINQGSQSISSEQLPLVAPVDEELDLGKMRTFIHASPEATTDEAVLGSSASAFALTPEANPILQKSESGWKLLGVPWFVWLAVAIAGFFAWRSFTKRLLPVIVAAGRRRK